MEKEANTVKQDTTDHPEWYDDSDSWADSDALHEEEREDFLPGWEQS